jgi:hypothetical protein
MSRLILAPATGQTNPNLDSSSSRQAMPQGSHRHSLTRSITRICRCRRLYLDRSRTEKRRGEMVCYHGFIPVSCVVLSWDTRQEVGGFSSATWSQSRSGPKNHAKTPHLQSTSSCLGMCNTTKFVPRPSDVPLSHTHCRFSNARLCQLSGYLSAEPRTNSESITLFHPPR